MNHPPDARVPVWAGDPALAGPGDAVPPAFVVGSAKHAAGCACCAARPLIATDLGRLYVARARGEVPFFARVVIACAPEDEPALAAALASDPVTAARFRFAGRLAAQTGSLPSPSPSGRSI